MSLIYIIIKTLRLNLKKFKGSMLCNIFCMILVFIYSTIYYNISNLEVLGLDKRDILSIMFVSLISVILFSVLFILYTNIQFSKNRTDEYGILLTLGISNKKLTKIIFIEYVIIMLISITISVVFGNILVTIIFYLIKKHIEVNINSKFNTYDSFLLIIEIFPVLYLLTYYIFKNRITRLNLSELYVDKIKNFRIIKKLNILPLVGIVISGYSIMLYKNGEAIVNSFFISFIGLFLLVYYINDLLLYKSKSIIKDMEIKISIFNSRKLLFVIALLTFLSTYLLGLAFSFYNKDKSENILSDISDITYISNSDIKTKVKDSVLYELNNDNIQVESFVDVDFITMKTRTYRDIFVDVVSEDNFRKFNIKIKKLKKNECILVSQLIVPEKYPSIPKGSFLDIVLNGYKKSGLICVGEEWYLFKNKINADRKILILNNFDYNNIKMNISKKYFKTFNIIFLEDENQISSAEKMINKYTDQVLSRIREQKLLEGQSLFVFCIIFFTGLLFLVSTGVIFISKLSSELHNLSINYYKLSQIGISQKQYKNAISGKLKHLFVLPSFIGIIQGFLFTIAHSIQYYNSVLIVKDTSIIFLFGILLTILFYKLLRNILILKITV
ncbi:ABC transporter permease [Thiospirochaeta perfilievii]|uniref:ABC transporter permease n=1 Tax=Thiospirochaeta perfilievii TaxID=252967 RepID=A0A5C1Q9I8_9SPIO|nr:FtsX-like permease family protein [Thiospirochaeta perfilievii]QEN04137.1 ABC transporter permease [Thiospirochaeta perfilievii]